MKNVKIGDAATLVFPADRYPYAVTWVSPSGHKIFLQAISPKNVPVNDNFIANYTFTADEVADLKLRRSEFITAHWSKKRQGYYVGGVLPLYIGAAQYYRNFMD